MKTYLLLNIDILHYEEIKLKTFIDWVSAATKSARATQMALISKPVQNYFNAHYTELENEFKELIKGYRDVDKSTKMELYANVTNDIFKHYPGALLPKLKTKEKTITNFN